ncbi:MAG TPA: hypothetical protein VF604_16065 [Pyrinomonadaceae bacterium]|jgi:hypothetical protein
MKPDSKRKWIQKCDIDDKNLPIPTRIVSNEEFAPPAQTVEQKQVEHRLIEIASHTSKRLGISRRRFLATSGGMAAAFPGCRSAAVQYAVRLDFRVSFEFLSFEF